MKPSGILMIVLGVFVIARLVTRDSQGETLAGRLSGGQPGTNLVTGTTPTSTASTGASTALSVQASRIAASGGELNYAKSFLTAIGAPESKSNIAALEDWWSEEEGPEVLVPGHGGSNNPFEVTTSGDANVPSTGDANSVGVKNYATPALGIEAAIGYFQKYGSSVLNAFRSNARVPAIEQAVKGLGPNAFGSDTDSPWAGS